MELASVSAFLAQYELITQPVTDKRQAIVWSEPRHDDQPDRQHDDYPENDRAQEPQHNPEQKADQRNMAQDAAEKAHQPPEDTQRAKNRYRLFSVPLHILILSLNEKEDQAAHPEERICQNSFQTLAQAK